MNTASSGLLTRAQPVERDVPLWFVAPLVVGLWMLARPYLGVRHDGVLYLGQVLQHLHPGLLERDLFFAFGSQDRFSVISSFLAVLQQALGMSGSQLLVLAVSHSVLLGAAAWLGRSLPTPEGRWFGLVALAAMSHFYGGYGIFAFAESFVTARTLAEPLALLALALWMAGRRVLAIGVLALSMAAHPLVALPVAAVCWLLLVQQDRRWAGLALGLAMLPAAALTGVEPFASLLRTLDAPWYALVREISGHVFVSTWLQVDCMALLLDVLTLAAASRLLGPPLAGLARALLLAVALLFSVSLIGADLLHNQLIAALQLWRVQWLAHLVTLLVLPALLLAQWSSRPMDRLAVLCCALAACSVNGSWESSWAFVLVAAGAVAMRWRRAEPGPAFLRAATLVALLALVGLSAGLVARSLLALEAVQVEPNAALLLWVLATVPTVSMGVAACALAAWRQPRWRPAAWMLVGALVLWAGSAWDRRSDWTRYIEQARPGSHPFSATVPPGAQVYWPDELTASWAVLGRPSYFTHQQGAGILFNRATAMEFERRREPLKTLLMQRAICQIASSVMRSADAQDDCVPDQEVLDDLCRHPAGPDFLILPWGDRSGIVSSWTFNPSAQSPGTGSTPLKTFHLYDCSRLR